LPGRACDEFVAGMRDLPIRPDRIPHFGELNEVLKPRTGWEIVAVPGLVPDDVFFDHLAHRRFPAGQFIRQAHQLDYLQEPDVFHDVFGHVPMLMNPVMADFIQAYGEGGLRAQRLGHLEQLARVYWYTVEFGLVQERDGLRLYGGGIASSYSESLFCLDSPSPNRIRFELERVMRTRYRIDDFQETYFEISDFNDLFRATSQDFAPLYKQLEAAPSYAPSETLFSDTLIQLGDRTYSRAEH
jgi:phenylalanine-4-hydroxylase